MTAVLTRLNTARSEIRPVPLDAIIIDVVQRVEGLDHARVDKMAAAFNPDALGVFILSERPDNLYACLDGMHRRGAAIKAGWTGDVDARVFTGLTLAEEASLFLLYNDKKDPSAISKFRARVLAGDKVAADIDQIVRGLGWKVDGYKSSPGSIVAVAAVEKAYRTGHGSLPEGAYPELLVKVIATITDAWGRDPVGAQDVIVGGLAQVYGRFGDAVDPDKLVHEMQGTQPRVLIGRARTLKDVQGGTVPAAMAKILVGMHNSRRRSNLLPEWVWVK